ncbi:MAG: VWA domain-containing protein [Desulfobacterales bacterium]|nr:VWA domain-containing protein [Desulfobacterales bacterium]
MKKSTFSLTVVLFCMLLCCSIGYALTAPKDIILMIDNSGSMKKGDPKFLTKNAVAEFVERLSDNNRVAVLIFDHRIILSVPLTIVSKTTKAKVLASLKRIDYMGRLTDIPAAMDLAIHELKLGGLESSQKSIIFITDGIVDTGNKQHDIRKTEWLRKSLSAEAAEHGIKIFGIAFTNLADFELIKFLAQKTKGDYFRAHKPNELPAIFLQIHQRIINMEPEPVESVKPAESTSSSLSVKPERSILEVPLTAPAEPEIEKSPIYMTEAPKPTPVPVKSKKFDITIIMMIILALAAVVVVILFLVWSRRKPKTVSPMPAGRAGVTDEFLPEASLRDVSDITEQGFFKISEKVTRIGRKDQINHIAIDQETISRQHATIEYKKHFFWIIDQGSSNGTFLNGQRIIDEERLNPGDIISLDVYELEFVMPGMGSDETVVDKTVFRQAYNPKED